MLKNNQLAVLEHNSTYLRVKIQEYIVRIIDLCWHEEKSF